MIKLSCENEFCIYQKEGDCIFEHVELDIQGNCANCIYVSIEEDDLKLLKDNILNKL